MIINMDCIAGMRNLPDHSVDSIVTDPPYELGFMGKGWDNSGIAYSVELWTEALRVLKPGGHLLAFSGSRTYHRMVCAIEDAGFEIRDQIMWVYGSGFPKSLDVSKAIDKRGGNPGLTAEIGQAIKAARVVRGMTATQCDQLFCGGTTNWSWFEGRPTGQRAPTPETFAAIVVVMPELAPLAEAVAEVEREVIGSKRSGIADGNGPRHTIGAGASIDVDITAPATEAARQWQGWGTALKPAHEPIVVARKPLIGTVAANVLAHGTGALNIDGCRVAGEVPAFTHKSQPAKNCYSDGLHGSARTGETLTIGRWPANLIHDGSDEVLAAFPQASGALAPVTGDEPTGHGFSGKVYGAPGENRQPSNRVDGGGSAARFFYCAKASKSDRNAGLDDFTPATTSDGPAVAADNAYQRGKTERANIHPTVKPTDLMRYLCRLVTPPSGLVLDPFAGSGSTGKAAALEGFQFVGFELSPEYTAIANARFEAAAVQRFAERCLA